MGRRQVTGEIRRSFTIEAPAPLVWAALVRARRQAQGFEVSVLLDGVKAPAFDGGVCARAILTALDEHVRRASLLAGRGLAHHAATLHVHGEAENCSRVVWTHRVWPEAAGGLEAAVEASVGALMRMFAR